MEHFSGINNKLPIHLKEANFLIHFKKKFGSGQGGHVFVVSALKSIYDFTQVKKL